MKRIEQAYDFFLTTTGPANDDASAAELEREGEDAYWAAYFDAFDGGASEADAKEAGEAAREEAVRRPGVFVN